MKARIAGSPQQSRTVIVGGPSAVLKKVHQPNSAARRSDPSLNPSPSQEEGDMPTVPRNPYVEPGTALILPQRDRIVAQAIFRNPKFPMEVVLSLSYSAANAGDLSDAGCREGEAQTSHVQPRGRRVLRVLLVGVAR